MGSIESSKIFRILIPINSRCSQFAWISVKVIHGAVSFTPFCRAIDKHFIGPCGKTPIHVWRNITVLSLSSSIASRSL